MTVKQARKLLNKKGIIWTWYMDLRLINETTNDSEIKQASHILMKKELRAWVNHQRR